VVFDTLQFKKLLLVTTAYASALNEMAPPRATNWDVLYCTTRLENPQLWTSRSPPTQRIPAPGMLVHVESTIWHSRTISEAPFATRMALVVAPRIVKP
jgi:hypothetical protein